MKNNQTFAETSQNITCEGMASFLFCLPVHDTWQSLSSFSDSNFFESQNRKSSFRYEYTIYGAYFEANSNPRMMKGRSSSFKIIWGRTKFWVKKITKLSQKVTMTSWRPETIRIVFSGLDLVLGKIFHAKISTNCQFTKFS